MRHTLARINEARRNGVQRGRPYIAGTAALVALIAVVTTGQYGVLFGFAILAGLFLFVQEFDRRHPTATTPPVDSSEIAPRAAEPVVGESVGNERLFDARLAETPGPLDYGQTLAQLMGLIGRRVQVMLCTGNDTRAIGEIHGTLSEGRDIAAEGEDESMLFLVDDRYGEPVGGFAMLATDFLAGMGVHDPRDPGVAFRTRGSVVWVFDEGAPEDHARRQAQRGDAQQ